MALDPGGNPWIYSEDGGLYHLNGDEFDLKDKPDTHNIFDRLAVDNTGKLWATSKDALWILDGSRWTE